MKWGKLAGLRRPALVIIGFGCLIAAGFVWHVIAGLVATGACALVLEVLTSPDESRR